MGKEGLLILSYQGGLGLNSFVHPNLFCPTPARSNSFMISVRGCQCCFFFWGVLDWKTVEEAAMEDAEEEQRRRLKLEEALEIQSLRRIISAYLKYNYSFLLHSSISTSPNSIIQLLFISSTLLLLKSALDDS